MEKQKKDPFEVKSSLEDVKVVKDHILARWEGFKLDFMKKGEIKVEKEWHNVNAVIRNENENLPLVKVIANYKASRETTGMHLDETEGLVFHYSSVPRVESTNMHVVFPFRGETVEASFSERYITDREHRMSGGGRLYFTGDFDERVRQEFDGAHREIVRALMADKVVAPAFKAEMERMEELGFLEARLEKWAQDIFAEKGMNDPMALQPVYRMAKEKGILNELIEGLRHSAKRRKESAEWRGDFGEDDGLNFVRTHHAETYERIADMLEKFREKPGRKGEKESLDRVAFDKAVELARDMMEKDPGWKKHAGSFAAKVIDAMKPVYDPQKFAIKVRKDSGFELAGADVTETAVMDYLYSLPRLSTKEEDEEMDKHLLKAAMKATNAGDLLLLSEEMLKRC